MAQNTHAVRTYVPAVIALEEEDTMLTLRRTGSWSPKFRSCCRLHSGSGPGSGQHGQEHWEPMRAQERWEAGQSQELLTICNILIPVCNRTPYTFTTQLTNELRVEAGSSTQSMYSCTADHWTLPELNAVHVHNKYNNCTLLNFSCSI